MRMKSFRSLNSRKNPMMFGILSVPGSIWNSTKGCLEVPVGLRRACAVPWNAMHTSSSTPEDERCLQRVGHGGVCLRFYSLSIAIDLKAGASRCPRWMHRSLPASAWWGKPPLMPVQIELLWLTWVWPRRLTSNASLPNCLSGASMYWRKTCDPHLPNSWIRQTSIAARCTAPEARAEWPVKHNGLLGSYPMSRSRATMLWYGHCSFRANSQEHDPDCSKCLPARFGRWILWLAAPTSTCEFLRILGYLGEVCCLRPPLKGCHCDSAPWLHLRPS